MATIAEAVREACLWLPETTEKISHGSPHYRVRDKSFASYVVNHHGDGRVALYLSAAPGAQAHHVTGGSAYFFVPPYVGPRGWLGLDLRSGIAWSQVTALVRAAYEHVAPAGLVARIGDTPRFKAPQEVPKADEIDPLAARSRQVAIARLRKSFSVWPEVSEGVQFGRPVWRVGKKGFALANCTAGRLRFLFWCGVAQQGLLTTDVRYSVPPYIGHNGWIALDVEEGADWEEVAFLALQSYRHFALKRILRNLDARL